jgi:uncharacterized protein YraI
MKKIAVLYVVTFICALVYFFNAQESIRAYAEEIDHDYSVYTITDVNMRMGPGLKYSVYKVLPEHSKIELINDQDPSGWYEVWYDNDVYFIYGKYIEEVDIITSY